MPINWQDNTDQALGTSGAFSFADGDSPALRLTLWPHSSLPRRGFVAFIAITALLFLLPLLGLLGTPALWVMLPFLAAAVALVWYFLQRSYTDATLREELTLWRDRAELTRHNPRAAAQTWHANPHWIQVGLRPQGGPVEHYLTLRGNRRTVEIGAFLSANERLVLHGELSGYLNDMRGAKAHQ